MMPDGYAMKLTQDQLNTAINALRVAAEVYDADGATQRAEAQAQRGACCDGAARVLERLAEQFDKQAREARELLDEMEQAE